MWKNWKRAFVLAALVPVAFTADAKKPKEIDASGVGPNAASMQTVFLRNSLDDDPGSYIGQFIKSGTVNVDESNAMPLTCSKFITYTKKNGGGVKYDEFYDASVDAAARVGVPLAANVSAEYKSASTIRVSYTMIDKLVAEIKDPAGFESCCKEAPDQCTDRYIGEFMGGTGEIYYAKSMKTGAGVKVALPQVGGIAKGKDAYSWERSIQFPQPVYFAFKTKVTPDWKSTFAACGDWQNSPPKSALGKYFVGISQPLATEADARKAALTSGREQVVKYVAESVSAGTLIVTDTAGASNDLLTAVSDRSFVETASNGVAKLVKDEAWCVTPNATPSGDVYVAKALMFLPKDKEQQAGSQLAAAAPVKPASAKGK
jgi:hypothetical protein